MKLEKILEGVPLTGEHPSLDMEISSISYDTRTLQPGALFVALPGDKTDGHRYIRTAVEQGAAAVLCRREPDFPGPWLAAASPPPAPALSGRAP